MVKHLALFVAWALLGFASSLGLLYLLTPVGPAMFLAVAMIAWVLEGRGTDSPGKWGFLAGPGLFCLLVGTGGADDGMAWIAAGTAVVVAATLAFMAAGRARCASIA